MKTILDLKQAFAQYDFKKRPNNKLIPDATYYREFIMLFKNRFDPDMQGFINHNKIETKPEKTQEESNIKSISDFLEEFYFDLKRYRDCKDCVKNFEKTIGVKQP